MKKRMYLNGDAIIFRDPSTNHNAINNAAQSIGDIICNQPISFIHDIHNWETIINIASSPNYTGMNVIYISGSFEHGRTFVLSIMCLKHKITPHMLLWDKKIHLPDNDDIFETLDVLDTCDVMLDISESNIRYKGSQDLIDQIMIN